MKLTKFILAILLLTTAFAIIATNLFLLYISALHLTHPLDLAQFLGGLSTATLFTALSLRLLKQALKPTPIPGFDLVDNKVKTDGPTALPTQTRSPATPSPTNMESDGSPGKRP